MFNVMNVKQRKKLNDSRYNWNEYNTNILYIFCNLLFGYKMISKCPFCHKPLDQNHDIEDDKPIINKAMMDLEQMKQDGIIAGEEI